MWDFMPEQASSYAADIDSVIQVITYTVGGWLLATYAVFFLFLFLFRKGSGRRAKYLPGNGRQMAWVLVPVFFVAMFDLGIDIYNAPVWSKVKMELPDSGNVVYVEARQWSWQFTYPGPDGLFNTGDDIVTVNKLHVQVDTKTRFVLTAADVLHSFSIPAFRLKQDAVPGRRIEGWFEAVKLGAYDIQCAEICGIGHQAMAARVIVHPPGEYEKALAAAASQPAAPPVKRHALASAELRSAFTSREQ